MSDILSVTIPVTVSVLLLNDFARLNITKLKIRIALAGLTAAKKMVAVRWKPPHSLVVRHWALTFLDVIYLSTARINKTTETNLNNWHSAANSLKEFLK